MKRTILKLVRRGRKEDFWGFTYNTKEVLEKTNQKRMMPELESAMHSERLQYHEAEARLYKVLREFNEIDLDGFKTRLSFKELNLDSLQSINLITAVEREFNTVFEEEVFDNFDCCEDILRHMTSEKRAF